jgi:hypothetical protein
LPQEATLMAVREDGFIIDLVGSAVAEAASWSASRRARSSLRSIHDSKYRSRRPHAAAKPADAAHTRLASPLTKLAKSFSRTPALQR